MNTPIKVCSEAYFSALSFFNEPEISNSGPPSLKSLPEDLCSGFLRPKKHPRPQPDLNPRTLDFETSRLPRDHRGRHGRTILYCILKKHASIRNIGKIRLRIGLIVKAALDVRFPKAMNLVIYMYSGEVTTTISLK